MAKSSISKYVKKPSKKTRNVAQRTGSWVSNAIKSVGYSTFDVLSDLMPSTIDVAKTTASAGKDAIEAMKKTRASNTSLGNAIDRNYYFGLGKEVFKNSLEDLKSGKFYNKERADKFFSDMNDDAMDMGDDYDWGDFEDFDAGEDDFSSSLDSSDGDTHATFHRKKGGNNESTSIVVNTNLGEDSALYQGINYQTETMVNVGQAVVDYNKANTKALYTALGGMRSDFNASLSAINENVASISTIVGDSLSKSSALSAKYYEDSIKLQTQILEAIKTQAPSTEINTRKFRDYNDVMDMFSSGGGINAGAYKNLVQKQFNNFVDSNMILSQLKFVAGEKDTLKMMAQNPLAFIPKAITKQLIPNTVKAVITEFDNQLKETAVAALNQVSGLQRSDNMLLSALGKIFGVQNKITLSSVDKSAYNKGATAWAGTDHQALTNVIPTLLRKIYSSISGSEEIVFDYEKGTYRKLRDVESEFDKDDKYRKTSMYSDYKSGFKEFLEQNAAMDRKQREDASNDFEHFLEKLTMDSAGGRTFRLNGRNGKEKGRDDIRELMDKSSSDDTSVKLVRAFLEGMVGVDNAKLTALFGRLPQEQRAYYDRTMREMQADPVKYNTMYRDTGLGVHSKNGKGRQYGTYTDSHLDYTEDAKSITGVKSGLSSGVMDKYGHNQTYYLREILTTLNTGIYVAPVDGGSVGRGGRHRQGSSSNSFMNAISARAADVTKQFGTDKSTYEASKPKTNTVSYTEEQREKDEKKGKLNVGEDFNYEQAKALAADYHKQNNSTSDGKPGIFGQLLSMVPEDTGLGKIIARLNGGVDKSKGVVTSVFDKADKALFALVFGDENGERGIRAIFDKAIGTLKTSFVKFSAFIDAKVLSPLEETLFGDDGLFTKIKNTEFWKSVSTKFKDLMGKADRFFLGEKDGEGNRSGGLFSETANELKDMGARVKTAILGEKGPDGKPVPLEEDNSVVGNLKRMFNGVSKSIGDALGLDTDKPKESLGTRISSGVDAVFNRLKERTNEFTDNVFGQYEGGSEFAKQFQEDMKGQKGFIGASAVVGAVGTMAFHSHMGLLGSMFLPGGPIGGALLGAGIGIASKSTGLKNYLFGPEVKGEDNKTYRAGGLITKEVQDFFKENKTGIAIGGFGGLAATYGLLPSFFLPGGPIGGAIVGGAISLATKSEEFQRILYGEGGTKDDPTGGISKKLKGIFGKDKNMKGLALDAGIGAGVGLIGSFFLPGGPILHALLGSALSVGTATEKFKTWFFGKDDGNGKRKGGVLTKFTDWTKEHIFGKLADGVKIAQNHIMGFIKGEMVVPFKYAMEPLLTEAKYVKGKIKEKLDGLFDGIKKKFNERIIEPIGETVDKYLLSPIRKALNKIFTGLGTLVGNIIAAPFRLISNAGKSAYKRQKKRGIEGYEEEVEEKYKNDRDALLTGEDGKKLGFFQRMKKTPERMKLWFGKNKEKYNREKRKEAQFSDKGAWYERGQEEERYDRMAAEQAAIKRDVAAKDYAVRNKTSVATETYNPPVGKKGKKPKVAKAAKAKTNTTSASTKSKASGDFISATEFAKRSGLSRTEVRRKLSSGEIQATRDESGAWKIPVSLIEKFRTKVSTDTASTEEIAAGTTQPGTTTAAEAVNATTGKGKRNKKKKEKTQAAAETTKVDTTTAQSASETAEKAKPKKTSAPAEAPSNFYTSVQKDTSQIASSVYGQLNGVGSNINKIYRLLLKKFNMKDDDIKGDNNKSYVGFFGRIRTALNRPFQAIKDVITAPFRKIADIGRSFIKKITNIGGLFTKVGKGILNAGKGLIGAIGDIAGSIGGILKELIKLPLDIAHTALFALRSIFPAVGEVLKTGVSLLGDGLKAAGTLLVDGVKAVGSTIVQAAKGLGSLISGALTGLGAIVKNLGAIAGDILKGVWTGAKFLGKGLWKGAKAVGGAVKNVAGSVVSAPFRLLGGVGRKVFGKGVQHVIVDSGTLDLVKKVNKVKKVSEVAKPKEGIGGLGGFGGKPIKPAPIKPAPSSVSTSGLGGFGEGDEKKPKLYVILDGVTNKAIKNILKGIFKVKSVISGASSKLLGNDNETDDTINDDNIIDTHFKEDEIDNNAGDTSVSTALTGGGAADDDADKTDNVEATQTTSTNLRDKISQKISNRQAQVDKGSRTSLLSRFAAADKDKEESTFRQKILSVLGRTAESTEEHKSLFSNIFSKKGLIGAFLIALLPSLIKFVPKVLNFLSNIDFGAVGTAIVNAIDSVKNLFEDLQLGDLIDGIKNELIAGFDQIGGLSGLINNVDEKVNQIKAFFTGEKTSYEVDENGNLVYDDQGNLVTTTEDASSVSDRISTALTPTRTRINTETGKWENTEEWTGTSGTTVKLVGKQASKGLKKLDKLVNSKGGQAVINGTKTVVKGAAKGVTKVAKTAGSVAKTAASKVLTSGRDYNAVKSMGEMGASLAKEAKVTQKAAGAVASGVDKVIEGATKVKDSDVIKTFIEKGKSAVEFLVSKLAAAGEKFGLNIPVSSFDDMSKMMAEKFFKSDILSGFKDKITSFMAKISGRTLAIAMDVGFAVYGVINGAANAGYLFEVDSDAVDTKMRVISAVFNGLLSTTVGSIIDFINSMTYEILGFNFIKVIATYTYKLFSNDEDSAALDAAQQDFTQGYEDYVQQEYDAYVKSTEEQGQEAMSLDEFKASDLSTTRSEYNSNQNKSLFKRAFDGVKSIGKNIGGAAKAVGSTIGGAVSAVGGGLKSAGSAVVNTAKNAGSWIKDKASSAGSAIASGAKAVGSTVVNAAKGAGSWVKDKVTGIGDSIKNSNIVKTLSSGVDNAKEMLSSGVSTVISKVKDIFGNVGSTISNLASYAVEAGKGLLTGFKTISDNFYNKDNDFMDYMKADVNAVDEDNPLHGIVGAVLNVAKVTMFPKLLIAGIFKKVGTAVVTGVKNIFTGAKTAITDYDTNVKDLNSLALAGDLSGLSSYEVTTSDDNPIGGVVSGMVGLSRIVHYPVALIAKVARTIAGGIKSIFTNIKTIATDYTSNVQNLSKLALAGDLSGLSSYEVETSDDNPISGFVSGMVGLSRIFHYPIALVSAAGHKIVDGIKAVFTGVKTIATDYVANTVNINKLALAGDLSGLASYEITTSEDNPLSGFTSGMIGLTRIYNYPIGLVSMVGHKIVEGIKTVFAGVKTIATDYTANTMNITKLALVGDLSGMANYEVTTSENNPLSGFTSGMVGVARIFNYPIGLISAAGHKIVDGIKTVFTGVKTIATDYVANTQNLTKLALAGDLSGLSSYEVETSEDNPLSGFTSGMVGVARIFNYPIGLISMVGHKVVEGIKNVFAGVKTIATDYAANNQNLTKLALSGDLSGLGSYEVAISEDNPLSGFSSGMVGVSRIFHYPLALVVAGGKKVVEGVKNVFTGVKTAATDYNTNVKNINKIAFSGDIAGLSSYEVTTSEDNPVSGFTSGMVGVARIFNYPIALVVAGGKKVVEGVKSAITGVKTAATDYNTNVQNLNKLSLSGDISGLSNYEVTTSEDNPVSGFTSGMVGLSRIMHYPIALVVAGGKKVVEGVKNAITGVKTAATDYNTNVQNLNSLSLSGDLEGLGNYEVTTSENNPVSGFVSGMVGISRIMHYPVALVVAGGKKIKEGVTNIITAVKETGPQISEGSTELGALALAGDTEGLHAYSAQDDEGNPVNGFAHAVLGIEKVFLTPVALVTSVARSVKDFFVGAVSTAQDYGKSVTKFVTKLNTYTDPDKDLSEWDNEKLGEDEDDPVASILGTIIKKVMWVYVGIIRTVKNAFGFIGDAVDAVKDGITDTVDAVKEGASNAWSWVSDKVSSAGTAIMNLGRGGDDGGRPLRSGGKGGSDEEELNGMPYYSQNDPKYKNRPYKQTGGYGGDDTIGDSGCGPTAMAMVASKFTGRDYNPVTMAKMAEDGGYSTSVGTTPGYFSAAGNALGIPNQRVSSAESVQTSLANGNPVILQGARGGSNNSPYTSEGHYVTATGMDGNNIIINDPRGKEYSGEYKMSDVMNDTTGAWSFGGQGGYGTGGFKSKGGVARLLPGGGGITIGTSRDDGMYVLQEDENGNVIHESVVGGTSTKLKQLNESGKYDTVTPLQVWIKIVKAVKEAIAAQQLGYSQSNYTNITVGGRTIRVRTDCSGFVQTCLKYFGVMDENTNITSYNVMNANDSTMKATGFTPYNFPGWENLKEGDILGRSGHTEIFAYNDGSSHYVYNCGSDSSCNNPNATKSSKASYDTIWRCGSAGADALSDFTVDGSSSSAYADSESSGFSSFSDLLSGLADAVMKPINKAFGLTTDDDSTSTSTGSSSSGSSSSSTDMNAYSASVGTDVKEKVWNFFRHNTDMSDNGIAGIMGNMYAESSFIPNNLQGSYEKSLGYTDDSYTTAVDNGSYSNFVNDSAGYGLVQFTHSSLKGGLLNYAKAHNLSVGDTDAQLNYIYNDQKGNSTWNSTRDAATPEEAAKVWMLQYEKPGNQSDENVAKRGSYARSIYDERPSAGSGGLDGGRPIKRVSQSLSGKQYQPGGKGASTVSQASSSIGSYSSATTDTTKKSTVQNANELSQMFKMALEYLSQISDNTGTTNTELEELNSKDFGNKYAQVNTTNNVVDTSKSNNTKSTDDIKDKSADRSEYSMAKRVAAGLLS